MMDAMSQGDVKPRQFPTDVILDPPAPVQSIATVRLATLADLPFIIGLAKEAYPGRDIEKGIHWMIWCIHNNPERLVLCGRHSVGVAQLSWQYGYERRSRLEMLASRASSAAVFEALHMVRQMVAWAKGKGAVRFTLDSDTGVDFGAFAKRLGARRETLVQYVLDLEQG